MRVPDIQRRLITKTVAQVLRTLNLPEPRTPIRHIDHTAQPDFKTLRILTLSSPNDEVMWQTEQVIIEHLRMFTGEVISIKAFHEFTAMLPHLNPDMLLFLGNPISFEDTDLEALHQSSVRTVIWLNDALNTNGSITERASLFDVVLTQDASKIPHYLHSGCTKVVHLPFFADRTVFYPKTVDQAYQSDILLIGDASPVRHDAVAQLENLFPDRVIRVWGAGWDSYAGITSFEQNVSTPEIFNGAGTVISWDLPQQTKFEIAACGAFHLCADNLNLYGYMSPSEDIVTFQDTNELIEKLQYYMAQADLKRLISTKAISKSKYSYSYIQGILKLLQTVYLS